MDLNHAKQRYPQNTKWLSLLLCMVLILCSSVFAEWQPANGPLMTRWATQVSPEKVHSEYPRPQMVRKNWQNLNGLWDYAIVRSRIRSTGRFLYRFQSSRLCRV